MNLLLILDCSAYSVDWLVIMAKLGPIGGRMLIIMDACHAGTIVADSMAEDIKGLKEVITSCSYLHNTPSTISDFNFTSILTEEMKRLGGRKEFNVSRLYQNISTLYASIKSNVKALTGGDKLFTNPQLPLPSPVHFFLGGNELPESIILRPL